VVDRSGSLDVAANKAKRACEAAPKLAKRVVFLSDQQQSNWRDKYTEEDFKGMPPMQVVAIGSRDSENTWISDFKIQDGIADTETPATLVARLSQQGQTARSAVQVTLSVDGVKVAAKTVSLEPGTRDREVTFHYTFDAARTTPGQPAFVPVKVSIPPDHLAADDERHLIVPVVAALKVVFIDQYSDAEENPLKNRFGETFPLRRLLVPVTGKDDAQQQVIRIRHLRMDELAPVELREELKDTRLVVVAGIASPGKDVVSLLREYVEQGGQLIVAAGGDFDPVSWNKNAWRDGRGILPAPLQPATVGTLPDLATGRLEWFSFANTNHRLLDHDYFKLAGNSDDQLAALYSAPMFFKAVRADVSNQTLQSLLKAEVDRLDEVFRVRARSGENRDARTQRPPGGQLGQAERAADQTDDEQGGKTRPQWLLFGNRDTDDSEKALPKNPRKRQQRLEELAKRTQWNVLARFDNGVPYLIQRPIEQGRVLFVSSGLLPRWNSLSKTYAIAVFDRILRSMIRSTLPQHNFDAVDQIVLPVTDDGPTRYALSRPGGEASEEPLDAGFVDAQTRAVTVRGALTRGLYRVTARNAAQNDTADDDRSKLWEMPLAVNGSPSESELTLLTKRQFDERNVGNVLRWVGPSESISLAGVQIRGQNWWMYLIVAVLVCLFAELAILAWPALQGQQRIWRAIITDWNARRMRAAGTRATT